MIIVGSVGTTKWYVQIMILYLILIKTIGANASMKLAQKRTEAYYRRFQTWKTLAYVFLIVLYLIPYLYPHLRESMIDIFKNDDPRNSLLILGLCGVFLIVGVLISYINPDFLYKVSAPDELSIPDTQLAKEMNRINGSLPFIILSGVVAFAAYFVTGSMMHLNIVIPLSLVLVTWLYNRLSSGKFDRVE